MKSQKNKKVANGIILFIIYCTIFIVIKSYIYKNELLENAISKFFILILLIWIIVKNILVVKFNQLPKFVNIYITLILAFLMSLYSFNPKYSIKSFLFYTLFFVIYIVLLKRCKEKLKYLYKKISIMDIFIIYILFHILTLIFEFEIFDIISFILIVNKFYFFSQKEDLSKESNFETLVTFLIFTFIFDFYYSFLIYLKISLKSNLKLN